MKNFRISIVIFLAALALLTSCSDNKSAPSQLTPPNQVTLSISPDTVIMDQLATLQFTVTGIAASAVTWSIREGTAAGSISAQGVYTAPATPGTFHVLATSTADSSRLAEAAINVREVTLNVSPELGDMEPGATQQFTATVTGTINRSVAWSVREGAIGGSITESGLYTAPAIAGTFHVIATTMAHAEQFATIPMKVTTLAVLISPRNVGLSPGATITFSASVAGCMDDRVTWSVQEGSAGGTITAAGLYTAPATLGEYHVVASSVAHPGLASISAVVVRDSEFTAAGNMTQSRSNHTATLLPGGDVLIAGGGSIGSDGYDYNTATAELFDHSTRTFRATGSMNTAREGHTATLLPNGKVLIAGGGWGGWISTNAAEIYDPATGQFTSTGNLIARRIYHTATLLLNGKVLIVGGNDGWMSEDYYPPDFAVAELYDPATGIFSPTGRMSTVRMSPTATLLADGRVLVTGGDQDWLATCANSAEIYDPATGNFVSAGSLVGERAFHTATLLADGRVLLAGGRRYSEEGDFTPEPYDDAQIFNPTNGQFGSLMHMNNYRSAHTATLLQNGQVLLAGGYLNSNDPGSTTELFDPVTATFLVTGSMTKPRAGHTATLLLDGRVLIAGGADDRSAELYTRAH